MRRLNKSVAKALSNPKQTPALQELHTQRKDMEHQAFVSLHQALGVNKTLPYLQLSNPRLFVQPAVYTRLPREDDDGDYSSEEDEELEATDPAVIERNKIE